MFLKAYFNTDDEIVWQEQAFYKVPTSVVAEKVYVETFTASVWCNYSSDS